MTTIRIVVPDAGPLITLAKLDLLDTLLAFKEDVRVVLTDYVEFEVTRRRNDFPDAMAIHKFIMNNLGRIEIEETGLGKNYKKLFKLKERLAKDPDLAKQLGVDLAPPEDPGEMTIIQYVRDLVGRPPGVPVLIMAEDDYFLRDVSPLPGNAHVVSTRAFLDSLPRIAQLKAKPALWEAVAKFRQGSNRAAIVDRPASKIKSTWDDAIDPATAAEAVRAARRHRPS
jgi:hypothetical protein